MSDLYHELGETLAKRASFMRAYGVSKTAQQGAPAPAASIPPTPQGSALGNLQQAAAGLPGWAYPLIGAGGGAAIAGLGSLTSRKQRRRALENMLYGGVAGGLLGSAVPLARAAKDLGGTLPSSDRMSALASARAAAMSGDRQQLSAALTAAGLPGALLTASRPQQLRAIDAATAAMPASPSTAGTIADTLNTTRDAVGDTWATRSDQLAPTLAYTAGGAAAGDVVGSRIGAGSVARAMRGNQANLDKSTYERLFGDGTRELVRNAMRGEPGAGRIEISPTRSSYASPLRWLATTPGASPVNVRYTPPPTPTPAAAAPAPAAGSHLFPGAPTPAPAAAAPTPAPVPSAQSMRGLNRVMTEALPPEVRTAPSRYASRGRAIGGGLGLGFGLYRALTDPATYGQYPDGTPIDPLTASP